MGARKCLLVFLPLLLACIAAAAQQDPASLEQRARAALARTNGTLIAAGLERRVRVLRDRWGVAHIYAANQHDLFFAQGFVAAQDRLFQMELWKRAGQGRLAEVLGRKLLARDINARRLRYRGSMDAEYASYGPGTLEILRAFTDGINAYIRSLTASSGPGLPIEFQLAGFAPELWKPEDCLSRMAAFSMTGNASAELYDAQLVTALGASKATHLLVLDPPVSLDPVAGLDLSGLSPEIMRDFVGSDTRLEFTPGLTGSNNWTVSGKLTASGHPLLANDPHRIIAIPSLRYIVHLVAPGWDVIGAGEPALPGVAAGHNQRIAWGFTIFPVDQQDLYIEQLDPADLNRYRVGNGWERMQTRTEQIAIKGSVALAPRPAARLTPETIELRFTRHGPVIWSDHARALALRWVGAEPGAAGYLASLRVDRAQNWSEFLAAMARWKLPPENIVYADVDGNIGEQSTGLTPLRTWTGLLPVPGSGGYEWSGFVPFSQLPRHFNPAQGFFATANNRTIPRDYPYRVGFEWAQPFRIERIEQVLSGAASSGHKLTIADFEQLQNDIQSLPGRSLTARLARAPSASGDTLAQLLTSWNGSIDVNSAAAALYELWLHQLTAAVEARVAPGTSWRAPLTVVLAYVSGSGLPTAEADAMLLRTLHSAAEQLKSMQGDDPRQWSWGKLHQIRMQHPLDGIAGRTALLDPPPGPRPGDANTVDATGYDEHFEQIAGASYREILDPSNWDNSLAINTPGQSGQPGSPHYDDLLPLWEEGKYFPLLYTQAAVANATENELTLLPASAAPTH